ncbi:hypothetical protein ACFUIY_31805 [Streptomyces griseorubiginosus]|uniref:hypothetical protein n=1 Tax=Streptomyces griseorubiginosus TaxID=67304 RepID=UPI0036376986
MTESASRTLPTVFTRWCRRTSHTSTAGRATDRYTSGVRPWVSGARPSTAGEPPGAAPITTVAWARRCARSHTVILVRSRGGSCPSAWRSRPVARYLPSPLSAMRSAQDPVPGHAVAGGSNTTRPARPSRVSSTCTRRSPPVSTERARTRPSSESPARYAVGPCQGAAGALPRAGERTTVAEPPRGRTAPAAGSRATSSHSSATIRRLSTGTCGPPAASPSA